MDKFDKENWKRIQNTLTFLKKVVPPPQKILDLGTSNRLAEYMRNEGYDVENTKGEDLDIEYKNINKYNYDVVTAFEIFEHMLAPFNILREIKAEKLVASVPLKLWFTEAYWDDNYKWAKHYHEFEPKQFDLLLSRTGWKIMASEKWTYYKLKFGIRPFLRMFTPRYYIVYCEKG